MLFNATLTRIDQPGEPTTGGDAVWTNGSEIAIRCLCADPSFSRKYALSQMQIDAAAIAYFALADVSSILPLIGRRLTIRVDGDTAVRTLGVKDEKRVIKGGPLDSVELILEAA